jgi:hypothetical protein
MAIRVSHTSCGVVYATTYSSMSLDRDVSRKFKTCCCLATKMASSGFYTFILLSSLRIVSAGTSGYGETQRVELPIELT